MLTVLGPSAWQRQPTTWDEKQIYRTYYVPEVHARLVSLGKLEGQRWDDRLCDGTMELRDRDGDLFANIARANNVYPVKLKVNPPKARFATWMTEGEDPTHEELVKGLGKVAMVATANGADGMRATLMPWRDGWVTRLSRLWLR